MINEQTVEQLRRVVRDYQERRPKKDVAGALASVKGVFGESPGPRKIAEGAMEVTGGNAVLPQIAREHFEEQIEADIVDFRATQFIANCIQIQRLRELAAYPIVDAEKAIEAIKAPESTGWKRSVIVNAFALTSVIANSLFDQLNLIEHPCTIPELESVFPQALPRCIESLRDNRALRSFWHLIDKHVPAAHQQTVRDAFRVFAA